MFLALRWIPWPHSIRGRVTVGFTLATAVLLGLACTSLYLLARRAAEHEADHVARDVLLWARDDIRDQGFQELREKTGLLLTQGITLSILGPDGTLWMRLPVRATSNPMPGDPRWRMQSADLPSGGRLLAGVPQARIDEPLRTLASALSLLSLVVVFASAVGAWVLVGHTLSPIGRLSRQAALERRLGPGNETAGGEIAPVRLAPPSQDVEVTHLVKTLNELLERIARSIASRGRFYAAASHELRTPLQALSGHLELGLMRERSAIEYRAILEEALRQTRRLSSLTQDLLTLNRLETGATRFPADVVDLTQTCLRAIRSSFAAAAARDLTITQALEAPIVLEAPMSHVEMLVRNLLENAIKYAVNGGCVEVSLQGGVLHVFNTYPAELPPIEAEKLFEPFYRPDRSRNAETGGNGLGLAICKGVSDANGWTIALVRDTRGVTVTVDFGTSLVPPTPPGRESHPAYRNGSRSAGNRARRDSNPRPTT